MQNLLLRSEENNSGKVKDQLLHNISCYNCCHPINEEIELCPQCGTYLHIGQCSFCGTSLEQTDRYCPECGNPRAGIRCSSCQKISHRSFCSYCNRPLNDLAQEEVNKVEQDPLFNTMITLADELADIEENDNNFKNGVADDISGSLADRYKDLLQQDNLPQIKSSRNFNTNRKLLYQQKVAEMQLLMDQLKADESLSPQMQRNYYCARKIPDRIKQQTTRQPGKWECNFCRCLHNYPGECVHPELGGRWIYITK